MANVNLVLPAPDVTGAENGFLDPAVIPASGVNVQVREYGGRALGQWVCARFTGEDGSKEETAPLEVLDTTTPMDFKISKDAVLKSTGRTAAFDYRVALTKDALYSDADPVLVSIQRGSDKDPVRFDDFEDLEPGGYVLISRPGFTVVSEFTYQIIVADGASRAPYVEGKYLTGESFGKIHIYFERPVVSFKLGVHLLSNVTGEISLIRGTQNFTLSPEAQWFEYAMLDPSDLTFLIKSVTFNRGGQCRIDNITCTLWSSQLAGAS